ncbi:TIGR04222 domain-containing membrane protein [Trebonia kvetii]|uniref:TIGR04222 domain-containing membrane protein n=1 Tax=Trebonia kvetii TaxID=2480626 RepID=A0A6P2BVY5_9ACTN|nr:TIGR04222 domain-containing membrane protein [Trebonia kvetii]TVZ03289.1 TIGR04222 domain-containing membrane protein [Trebonia kvetii]
MSQPWGLSGPQFLVIYGVGTAVAVVVPFLLRLLIRFDSSADAGRQLDPHEVGYLAGGPARAAQVIITDFVTSGAVRVDTSGRVTAADRAAFDRQSALLSEGVTGAATLFAELWLPAGVFVHQLQSKIAKLPAIAVIKARLRAEGLLVSRARTATVWIVSLTLWAALFVTGSLRLAEGAHNHRPIGNLQGLVVLSAFACLFSLLANRSRLTNLTTFRGAGLLRRLRSAERRTEKETARQSRRGTAVFSHGLGGNGYGFGAGIGSAALFGVALAGFAAVADEPTRSALLAGLPSSSGGSGCGGGGGGCGGGGCGGGGCGG